MQMFESYYKKKYWLINILPEQVPPDGEGQFFAASGRYKSKYRARS